VQRSNSWLQRALRGLCVLSRELRGTTIGNVPLIMATRSDRFKALLHRITRMERELVSLRRQAAELASRTKTTQSSDPIFAILPAYDEALAEDLPKAMHTVRRRATRRPA
jgi:hypothetical protein